MDSSQIIIIIAGFAAGLMNSVAGGGTILTYPALLAAGLTPIEANATSTVALLAGILSSIGGYRKRIGTVTLWLKTFIPVSVIGGLFGAVLLLQTPEKTFGILAPFLIIGATVLFGFQGLLQKIFNPTKCAPKNLEESKKWWIISIGIQLLVSIYGGYFGAGIGIMMLASLSILGFQDIHEMNTVKAILAFAINVIAAVYFILFAPIAWMNVILLACGAFTGGYLGAVIAQSVNQKFVRLFVVLIGCIITLNLFYKQFFAP